MNSTSRKKNVIKNMFVGTIFQVICLLMGFVNRTFFIKLLSEELGYAGNMKDYKNNPVNYCGLILNTNIMD